MLFDQYQAFVKLSYSDNIEYGNETQPNTSYPSFDSNVFTLLPQECLYWS